MSLREKNLILTSFSICRYHSKNTREKKAGRFRRLLGKSIRSNESTITSKYKERIRTEM